MSDMTVDIFAKETFGKIALVKMGDVPKNFRLYDAGWLGTQREVMRVTGALFRKALSGKNKGKLSIKMKGTIQSVLVTAKEMAEFEQEK